MGTSRFSVLATLLTTVLPLAYAGPAAHAAEDLPPPGTVLSSTPLPQERRLPGVAQGWQITYVTTDTFGARAVSTGTVQIPAGTPPAGGWPVVSWAHGTVGIADDCAPSDRPPTQRDADYLGSWLAQGYAVVATDYVGLGTPGLHTYLDGRTTAHNIVDAVKAGHDLTEDLAWAYHLDERWVTIGQSQGAGGSIYAARWATAYGGPGLDYRGAVGTGTPAYIESYVMSLGPNVPPTLPGGTTAFLAYILAGLRYAHPELDLDAVLTPTGRKYVDLGETLCMGEFATALEGTSIGTWFTKPLANVPGFKEAARDYLGMPTSGFDRPFFMAHGALDVTVPAPFTLLYVSGLLLRGEPLTFRTYVADHSGTMTASRPDTIPFVARLFAAP